MFSTFAVLYIMYTYNNIHRGETQYYIIAICFGHDIILWTLRSCREGKRAETDRVIPPPKK